MTSPFAELAERIRAETPELERVVQRIERVWRQGLGAPAEQEVYLAATALNLHSFYSGLERLFELVARHLDGNLPDSETWHRDLLRQMARDIPDARPAVIDSESALALDEFRRFRHIVRNIYTMNLRPERMAGLISALPALWARLHSELSAFADFLEQVTDTPRG
jgi:hypothetical protein